MIQLPMNTNTPSIRTRSQLFSERAYSRVAKRRGNGAAEYVRFAKRLPALIHTCGLAQSASYAEAKGSSGAPEHCDCLADLAYVIEEREISVNEFCAEIRSVDLPHYLRLSQQALAAADWLKRAAEALLKTDHQP